MPIKTRNERLNKMDNDTLPKKAGSRKFSLWIIIFAVFLVCNVAIFFLFLDIKTKIDAHNRILLTLPPDLQNKIFETFQHAAKELNLKITKNTQEASTAIIVNADKKSTAVFAQISETVKKQLKEINAENQLTYIKKQVDAIGKNTDATAKILAELKVEREQKAINYLKAARASIQKPEIAHILYVSALTYSNEKSSILSEFIDWQASLIKQALSKNDLEDAQERLVALASICDANIAAGSINDMTAIPELKNKIAAAEKLIASYKKQQISTQKERLAEFLQKIDALDNFVQADSLLKELSAFSVDSSLSGQKDDITALVIRKQSYLTTPSQQLIIPTINEATPWCAWLKNFIVRLQSNLPTTQKLEDLGTAAEFLQAAKTSNAEGVGNLITEIEKTSRGVYLSYWKERVERALIPSSQNRDDVATLIAESNTFSPEEAKAYKNEMLKLHKFIVQATLNELKNSLKILKGIENTVSDETYMQMVAATQSQYLQLLLRIKELDTKFIGDFSKETEDITQKIAHLGQLLNSYKNRLVIRDLRKNEAQRSRFVGWAKNQLIIAEVLDNEGETIASEGLMGKVVANRSRDAAVVKYIEAWTTLMCIHPSDLQVADPALFQHYNELKNRIEKHWPPSDAHRSNVTYKRISDF